MFDESHDIQSIVSKKENCCEHCSKEPRCKAWIWEPSHSGRCWLKSVVGPTKKNMLIHLGIIECKKS